MAALQRNVLLAKIPTTSTQPLEYARFLSLMYSSASGLKMTQVIAYNVKIVIFSV